MPKKSLQGVLARKQPGKAKEGSISPMLTPVINDLKTSYKWMKTYKMTKSVSSSLNT